MTFMTFKNDCRVFRDAVQIETDEKKLNQPSKEYNIIKKPQFLPSLYLRSLVFICLDFATEFAKSKMFVDFNSVLYGIWGYPKW